MRKVLVSLLAAATIVACNGDRDSSDTTGEAPDTTAAGAGTTDTTTTTDTADTADTTETETTETTETTDTSDSTEGTDATAPDDTTASTASGEVGENEADYVDAIVDDYEGDNVVTATCIAEEVVSAVGLEQLQTAGVTPQALVETSNFTELGITVEDPDALEAGLAGCGDGFLVLTLSEIPATPESEACAEENISDDLVAQVVVDSLLGEQPSEEAQAAAEAFDECLAGDAGTATTSAG